MNARLPVPVAAAPEADFVEIAAALGIDKSVVRKRSIKGDWPYREQAQRGGKKRLFPLATLPPAVREKVQHHRLARLVAVLPTPTFTNPPAPVLAAGVLPATERQQHPGRPERQDRPERQERQDRPAGFFIPPHENTARQNQVEWARERLIAEIVRLRAEAGCSQEAAITTILTQARAGTLPAGTLAMLRAAKDGRGRKGQDDLPSPRSIKRFIAEKSKGRRLAPAVVVPDMEIKPWYGLLVTLLQRPQGSTLGWVHEQIEAQWQPAWGEAAPSYHAVRRAVDKLSMLDRLKGRWSGSQLRSRTFYQHRSSAGMLPWDEIHADGWNTHFTAPHPVTAEYVTYEVWHAHDVATRFVPPFGIGLAENFEVISSCIENAYRAGGCPLFVQTDSTRIIKNSEKFKTNPATAIADRAGFTIVHPQTVGNSQANGIAENFNTWMDRESRELATYQHPKRMDELSFKRGRKLTAAMVRAAKAGDVATMHAKRRELERTNKGLVLTSFEQAINWLEEKRQKWNHKPHRALPKTARDEKGRLRHQTPFEALMEHIDAGWTPSLPELDGPALERHLVELFWTHVQIKVTRGAVTPYGGMRYRHAALDEWLGKEVVVAYDMTDWRRVLVKTLKGEPICFAEFVEATGYRTLSAKEFAEEKRAGARVRNKQRQIEAEQLAVPGLVVEQRAAILDFLPAERVPEAVEDVRIIDLLPVQPAEERELTHMETVALFMRRTDEDEDGDTPLKEVAAG